MSKKAKTLFDHLSGIREKKISWDSLSEMDKKSFTPFVINRWLSMDLDLLTIVNELQKYTIGTLTSKDVYKLYHDFLPKQKSYDKYIKSKKEGKYNKKLLEHLSQWYKVSQREVIDYLEILSNEEIITTLTKFGIEKKEAKKLLK